jgi:hypothetical protein
MIGTEPRGATRGSTATTAGTVIFVTARSWAGIREHPRVARVDHVDTAAAGGRDAAWC